MTYKEGLSLFSTYLKDEKRYSEHTIRNYNHAVNTFFTWANSVKLNVVDKTLIRNFIIEFQRTHSRRTLHNWISALRSFYNYLIHQNKLEHNPFDEVTVPKLNKPLPKFMTQTQMADLLRAPSLLLESGSIKPFEALRDTMVLELLYGAGLRVSELVNLNYGHIEWSTSILRIMGKGKKERRTPAGTQALKAIEAFRDGHAGDISADAPVVLSNTQKRIGARQIQLIVKKYLKLMGLPEDLSPHKVRHSYATHMVSNGADLRVVQELMGHASLSTTQIYTHVDFERLKQAHTRAHPRG